MQNIELKKYFLLLINTFTNSFKIKFQLKYHLDKKGIKYLTTENACLLAHAFLCMYSIYTRSVCMRKTRAYKQAFKVTLNILNN